MSPDSQPRMMLSYHLIDAINKCVLKFSREFKSHQ